MVAWQDEGIILGSRLQGEQNALVHILTPLQGRYVGILRGVKSKANRALIQPGTFIQASWNARLSDHIGTWKLDLISPIFSGLLEEKDKLLALEWVTQLALNFLPERDPHLTFYKSCLHFLTSLKKESWKKEIIKLEVQLLQELGFGLKLNACGVTGRVDNLNYVSPRTGQVVTDDVAAPYKDKLLKVPSFLSLDTQESPQDILEGMRLTGYFLEKQFGDPKFRSLFNIRKRLVESL